MHWLPAVGILNENLVKPPSAPELKAWWSGPTLLQAIDSFNSSSRQIDSPLRLPVNDIFKGDRGGQSVGGKIEAGAIKVFYPLYLLFIHQLLPKAFKAIDLRCMFTRQWIACLQSKTEVSKCF